MPLARVVAFDAVRLLLTRIELPDRQQHIRDGGVVRAVEPGAPARQALDQALAGDCVTTAAFPVHPRPWSTILMRPDSFLPGHGCRTGNITSESTTTSPP